MIVTTRLKSGQLTNLSQCPAEQSESQTQRVYTPLDTSKDPKPFHITGIVLIVIIVMSFIVVVVVSVPRGAVEEEGR